MGWAGAAEADVSAIVSGVERRAVEVSAVVKRFVVRGRIPGRSRGVVEALRGVDLVVPRGAICAVIGPNGSGKSTLLRLVVTLLLPDAGRVVVGGVDAVREPVLARRMVGFSSGNERGVYWRLTGRENLEFFAALHHVRHPDRAIADVLAVMDLSSVADRPVMTYSQGMLHRLGLARALLHRPEVLVLDEPGRSLDPPSRDHLHALLRRLRDDRQVSILLATHDLSEAACLADEVTILDRGLVSDRLRTTDPAALRRAWSGTIPREGGD